jgi:Protein of unknown function (DUF3047)
METTACSWKPTTLSYLCLINMNPGHLLTLLLALVLTACAHRGEGEAEGLPQSAPAQALALEAFPSPLAQWSPPLVLPPISNAGAAKTLNGGAISLGPQAWRHYKLPGKRATQFQVASDQGRKGLRVQAKSSASMMRYALRVEPQALGALKFSWKVPQTITEADVSQRDLDDSPVRLVLAFEGDTSKFSARNAMLSELSRTITGEPLPYATLMYVWCNTSAQNSVVLNPRTDRIRKIVLESGGKNLGRWLDYERDIRADFIKAFGEEPGALLGVALMTDTDNTQGQTMAYYGPVALTKAVADGRLSDKPSKVSLQTLPAQQPSLATQPSNPAQ